MVRMDSTDPITLVALTPLDDALRRRLVDEHGEPSLVIDGAGSGGHLKALRQLETNEPVGTLVVVADGAAPAGAVSEIGRFGARYRDVVYVTP